MSYHFGKFTSHAQAALHQTCLTIFSRGFKSQGNNKSTEKDIKLPLDHSNTLVYVPATLLKMSSINVFARWRPLSQEEVPSGEINHTTQPTTNLASISITHPPDRPWTSPAAFHTIFNAQGDNATVYAKVVAPTLPKVLRGETCSFFAYGHSGSGKTHTILGYGEELGLCVAAAEELFAGLCDTPALGVGFSLFELRQKAAFDLLNGRAECHVRQGPDGRVHIRGETEVLEGGKVRVRPIVQRACWDFVSFRRELLLALEHRETGKSNVHDQSSRTHAVLELEVISQALMDARREVIERQSELVPVGKRATDVTIEEDTKSFIATPGGGWEPNPDYQRNQALIDVVQNEKALFESRVTAAEEAVEQVLQSSPSPSLGAKMVFVDLAGAEYSDTKAITKQTPQERQEGREINTDLLALKEVMRAWSKGSNRIPFRSSTLTMVLREHFINAERGNSAIIVTVSPAEEQYAATLNSLRYASLVGAIGG